MTKTTDKILNLMLMDGIVLTALGICAILLPNLMSFTTSIILSIILTIFGVYKFINTIMMRKEIKNPYLSAIIGLLIISAGIYLFFHPIFNLLLLTILIALYFILESILELSISVAITSILAYENNLLITLEPMNPLAPVTKIFTIYHIFPFFVF